MNVITLFNWDLLSSIPKKKREWLMLPYPEWYLTLINSKQPGQ